MIQHATHWMSRTQKSGFTLVELIVVIAILTILGTIGFLSVNGYSLKSRDSVRVTDIASLAESLNLSSITTGSYPAPNEQFTVTYSGAAVWYQGIAGDQVIRAISAGISGGGPNAAPKDPLSKKEYTYSTLAYGSAFQLKADYEGDIAYNAPSLIPEALAATGAIAHVKGNYGGVVARTQTGNMVYLLAIPSILSNTGSVGQTIEISANLLSGSLIFDGKPTYASSTYNPNQVVFSGATLPSSNAPEITTIATKIQQAYSGSDIANYGSTRDIVAASSSGLTDMVSAVIKNQLGGTTNSNATVITDRYTKVSTSGSHTCGLLSNGHVRCWGNSIYGEIGNGTTISSPIPVEVIGLSGKATDITTTIGLSCAIISDGTVQCWGYDFVSLSGTNYLNPTTISGLSSVVGIDAVNFAGLALCAVTNIGEVKCLGNNGGGRLGDGTTTRSATPITVTGISSGAKSVSLGRAYGCAIMNTGVVKCWGKYKDATLATATDVPEFTTAAFLSPLLYPSATLANGSVVYLSGSSVSVPAGLNANITQTYNRTNTATMAGCGITTGGGVKCWDGLNGAGDLGDGTTIDRGGAVVDVVGLASGAVSVSHYGNQVGCAILATGGLKCWGLNNFGQLGNGTTANSSIPVDVLSPQ